MARPRGGYALADGAKAPGVTTVIKTLGECEGLIHWAWKLGKDGQDYRQVKQKAADVGTLAHDMIEAHLRGTSPPTHEDKAMLAKAQRAFESWRDWFDKQDILVEPFERPLVSERHRFGGTIDALGRRKDNRKAILVDWKTSKRLYPEYLAQLGGYALLASEAGEAPTGAVVLRADKERDMTWETITLSVDQLRSAATIFLAALKAHRAREQAKAMLEMLQG
jgi:hypothetical protein